jgi:hypothetical protein
MTVRIIKLLPMIVVLSVATGWGVCAVYFGDSRVSQFRTVLAAMFAVSGVLTIISLAIPAWRSRLLIIHSILFLAIFVWWLNIKPSNDRQWQSDVEKLSYATFQDHLVTVHNIRNFDYRSEFDYRPAYYTKTFDLDKLEGVDLFAVYWMGPAIAHTIVSFNFGEGNHLAVSIEARKEKNEGYSTIKGFFRQYELIYIVADERDIIRLRTNYRQNPQEEVYLYRLLAPKENAKRVFLDYFKDINKLNENPAFYNTLIENCTTTIWLHSRVNPGHLPFSWKILLSGYVPEYLYENGRIDQRLPFTELQQRAHINNAAHQADQGADFSERIRKAQQ